jgi:hypothetical protein
LLHAVSKPDGYEVSDYVNPKALFDYRDVEVTHVKGKVYRVFDRSRPLHRQSPPGNYPRLSLSHAMCSIAIARSLSSARSVAANARCTLDARSRAGMHRTGRTFSTGSEDRSGR